MESSDNRLVFHEPIPPLLEYCAFRAALNLWIYKIQSVDQARNHDRRASVDPARSRNIENENPAARRRTISDESLRPIAINANTRRAPRPRPIFFHSRIGWMSDEEVEEMTKGVEVPSRLIKQMGTFIRKINRQIINWVKNHREWAIFSNNEIMTSEHLNLVIWRSNGTIDYEKTARQLVRFGGLDSYQRFDFICEYFMEDELRRESNLWFEMQDEDSDIFIGYVLMRNPTVVYWNSIISEQFPEYWTPSGLEYFENRARARNSYNFSSITFALQRFQADDRILLGIRLLQNAAPELVKFLVPKFTELEQLHMFSTTTVAFGIIDIFARFPEYTKLAIQTWVYTRSFAQGEQYIRMMSKIGALRCDPSKFVQVHRLLVDLWRNTPIALKRYVYNLDQNTFVTELCIVTNEGDILNQKRQRDHRILIEILSDASIEYRKKLWQNAWRAIVKYSRVDRMKKIMEICLSTDEIVDWKRRIVTSDFLRGYFRSLIQTNNLRLLNDFYDFLVPDDPRRRNLLKRELLEGVEEENLFQYVRVCNIEKHDIDILCEFISEVFEGDKEAEDEFRIKIISACFSSSKPCPGRWLERIFQIANLVCEGELQNRVRARVAVNLQRFLQTGEAEYDLRKAEWCKLLRWSFVTNERIGQFKASLKNL